MRKYLAQSLDIRYAFWTGAIKASELTKLTKEAAHLVLSVLSVLVLGRDSRTWLPRGVLMDNFPDKAGGKQG